MTKTIRGILLIANLPIYYLVFKQAFHTKEEFLEALKYYFQPDLLSTVKGETLEDMKYSQKLAMWLLEKNTALFTNDITFIILYHSI